MTESHRAAFEFLCGVTDEFVPRWKFWRKSVSQEPAIQQACACLEDAAPDEVLARLCGRYWHAAGELRTALGPLVFHLAARLAPHAWPKVDESIRNEWDRSTTWSPATSMRGDAAAILVAICHPSGQVRERGLRMTGSLPPAIETGLLLVRANDWAKPVRTLAADRMESALARLAPEDRIRMVPLVARLRKCGRLGNPAGIENWFDRLAESLDEAAWLRAWSVSRGEERRSYLELLKRLDRLPGPDVRGALFGSNDRSALMWYVKSVLPRLNETERSEATAAMARSHAVPVWKHWLLHRIECDPSGAVPDLVDVLTDRSHSLRHFARFHLARLSPMDFEAHYHAGLANAAVEPWALRGLTEVSPSAGHREALARLSSGSSSVKKAAIECLDYEVLGNFMDDLLNELATGHPGPAKAARRRLGEIIPLLGCHLTGNPSIFSKLPPEIRAYLVRVSAGFSKWQALDFLLHQAGDPALSEVREEALRMWIRREGRSFIKLPVARKRNLLATLPQCRLPGTLEERVRFLLEHAE